MQKEMKSDIGASLAPEHPMLVPCRDDKGLSPEL
jgi:hypothetical protein